MGLPGIGGAYVFNPYKSYSSYADATVSAAVFGSGNQASLRAAGKPSGAQGALDLQMLKHMGRIECQTCKSRTYQDGSNDPGVSFKAPGHIDPASSGAVVRSHEQEHVANERAKASSEGRRVISQSVRTFTSVCPECGRTYVSGGVTRTVTASDKSRNGAVSRNTAGGKAKLDILI